MSDKKQPEQAKADKQTSTANSNIDNQNDISAALKINSPLDIAEKQPANTDSNKAAEKAPTKATELKKSDKATAPVKEHTASPSSQSKNMGTKSAQKNNPTATSNHNKISKLAILALIIALLAIAASAGHYYWSEQQKRQYGLQIDKNVQNQLVENQQKISQQLLQNKQQIAQQFSLSKQANTAEITSLRQQLAQLDHLEKSTKDTIAQLAQKITSLSQNQPNDWLLQEAEYLIRVASRSLWLEKDTRTAISLLEDADLRIQELNDPQYLALRQVIQQDITTLQLLPQLATDKVIIKLMALEQQIKQLPLAIFEIPVISVNETNLELTDSASDWRENLAKTWHKFIAEFFTVTRRTGDIEPLMSPQFQQNLRENLNLKLQTAIWAASKGNSSIYLQALDDIVRWLNDYFDVSTIENQNFLKAINALKTATIDVTYPNELAALAAMRQALTAKKRSTTPTLEQKSTSKSSEGSATESEKSEQREGI